MDDAVLVRSLVAAAPAAPRSSLARNVAVGVLVFTFGLGLGVTTRDPGRGVGLAETARGLRDRAGALVANAGAEPRTRAEHAAGDPASAAGQMPPAPPPQVAAAQAPTAAAPVAADPQPAMAPSDGAAPTATVAAVTDEPSVPGKKKKSKKRHARTTPTNVPEVERAAIATADAPAAPRAREPRGVAVRAVASDVHAADAPPGDREVRTVALRGDAGRDGASAKARKGSYEPRSVLLPRSARPSAAYVQACGKGAASPSKAIASGDYEAAAAQLACAQLRDGD